jgi:hypothetical protein
MAMYLYTLNLLSVPLRPSGIGSRVTVGASLLMLSVSKPLLVSFDLKFPAQIRKFSVFYPTTAFLVPDIFFFIEYERYFKINS